MLTLADREIARISKESKVTALRAKNPQLVPGCDVVTAAKNIRIELKRAFPGVKFSVKSDRFSMGNSIDVRWEDGPTAAQVKQITCKYEAGSFDDMTDCYNYADNPWGDAFGETKYMHTNRSYSDAVLNSVIGRVCRYFGGLESIPTADDWKAGRIWNLYTSSGIEIGLRISQALSRHTCCIGEGVA